MEQIKKITELSEKMNELYNEYKEGFSPYENEITVHLVVPLLKFLGWSELRMSLEFHLRNDNKERTHPDILLYSKESRKPNDVKKIIEVKTQDKSCEELKKAAQKWINRLENKNFILPQGDAGFDNNIDCVIATDGIRYLFYEKDEKGKWNNEEPTECLNLNDTNKDTLNKYLKPNDK